MGHKILIIDDSATMRQMINIILKGAGHEVVQASEGSEGLAALDNSFDLVITDYNMPNMNGAEVIRRIRGGSAHPAVPVLMVTTESEDAKKQEGKEAGATGWVTKPFQKEQLLGVIDKVLSRTEF
ncbi:response regulator [Spirochaeta africana]|uniref:Response regulator with CheY-like receiver domain and winged-helix DNA-binding domain n=1 Tax=Spirochaeta africana (strain ATCC 700263 / DSM 8902 / Z-7692) TaxID=889378 RepID=H9ULL5_SPIAZ|nr:response regulator [Spirochaeta africana]AFG38408.1 response regulator with CheY-like receiver domain and winged-helix DNA-binding domain [Spirochaeta africana DSM 8902]